ncbi:Putative cytoplasmic protein [Salmonella enterica]|nr:Putative cytoplasmic protein [Salmonella enterica]
MNNANTTLKVLFIGESWHIHMIHSKGYDSFTSSKYEEGATWLLACLKKGGVSVDYMPAHTVQIAFLESVDDLNRYDVIVISDIGSNTFLLQNDTFYQLRIKPNALELIKEYVRNGGGLLMIGGYLSFMGIEAKANYKNTTLAEVLPVVMPDGDDRVEKPEGVYAQVEKPEHPVIKGFSDYPPFLGYNQAVAKENTAVVLTINNDPLLVFGEYHHGKTACFMSDCAPHWGTQQFMAWPFYTDLWINTLKFIAKR